MELAIDITPNPERYVIAIGGEIDISNADRLRDAINMALRVWGDVDCEFHGNLPFFMVLMVCTESLGGRA